MEHKTKKQKLQTALRLIRKQYMDSIELAIINEPEKTYSQIAAEHGVSRQFVLDTAQKRGCGRCTPAEGKEIFDPAVSLYVPGPVTPEAQAARRAYEGKVADYETALCEAAKARGCEMATEADLEEFAASEADKKTQVSNG